MKIYKINDVTLSETELRKLIKENPELKEEKLTRWKPENGEEYWLVDSCGCVSRSIGCIDRFELFRWRSKNCFKTMEEAKKALERIEAINIVTLAIEELNEGWVPDWGDDNQRKYYIYYNHYYKDSHSFSKFHPSFYYTVQFCQVLPYIKSKYIAEQIIKDYEEELKIIFEIE